MKKQVDSVNQISVPAEDDVLELIHAVMHQVRSRQMRGLGSGAHEIAPMEGKVLGFFSRHPGSTQRDLVEHSGRDKGQIARLIASLKDRGLLHADADPLDKRVIRLHLTTEAQALHLEVQRQRRELSALAVQGMTAPQKRDLLQLLQAVKANLREAP